MTYADLKSGSSEPDSLIELLERFMFVESRKMHFCTVGQIESYDPETQSVDVKPLLKKPGSENGEKRFWEQPVITMAPVQFMRLGGFVLRCPLNRGDRILILHTDYMLDEWFHGDGSIVDPISRRAHMLTDGIVLPLSPSLHHDPIPNVGDGDFLVGCEDGAGGLRIKTDGKMELGSDSATKKGVARLDDQVKSTPAEDSAFWQWAAAVDVFIRSLTGVADGVTAATVGLSAGTYSAAPTPTALTGKIIEASSKVETE